MQEEATKQHQQNLFWLMFDGFLGDGRRLASINKLDDPLPEGLAATIEHALARLDTSYRSHKRESRQGTFPLAELDGIDQVLLLDPQEQAAFVTAFDQSMVAHLDPFYALCHGILDLGGLRSEQMRDYFTGSPEMVFADSYRIYLTTLGRIGASFFRAHETYASRLSADNPDFQNELRQQSPRNMAMFTRTREPYDPHCHGGCSDDRHVSLDGMILRIKAREKIGEKFATHLARLLGDLQPANHLSSEKSSEKGTGKTPMKWNDVLITDILGVAAMGHREYSPRPGKNVGPGEVIDEVLTERKGLYRSVKAKHVTNDADPTPSPSGRVWKEGSREYAEGYNRLVFLGLQPFTIDVRRTDWPNHAISALGANGHHRLSRASWYVLIADETYGPLYERVAARVNALLGECFFPSAEEFVLERKYRLVDYLSRRVRVHTSPLSSSEDFDRALGTFVQNELKYDQKKVDSYKSRFSQEMCHMLQAYNRVIEHYLALPLEIFFPSSSDGYAREGSAETNGIDVHTIAITPRVQRLLRQAHDLAQLSDQMYGEAQCSNCRTQKGHLRALNQNLTLLQGLYTDVIAFTDDPLFGNNVRYTLDAEQTLSDYFDQQLKTLHIREGSDYPELGLQHQIGLLAHLRALHAYTCLMDPEQTSSVLGDRREALERFQALRQHTTGFYTTNQVSFPLPARVRYQGVMARAESVLSSLAGSP